jgi:uncharacterized protein YciI
MQFHICCNNNADYLKTRERPYPIKQENPHSGVTYRQAHVQLHRSRSNELLAAGPSLNNAVAHLFYDVPNIQVLQAYLEEDPYVEAGIWHDIVIRPFRIFSGPPGPVPPCLDGTRRVVSVEGKLAAPPANAQALLDELNDIQHLVIGGVLEDGRLLAWLNTNQPDVALQWLAARKLAPADAITNAMLWAL